jgi:hypothetical protein
MTLLLHPLDALIYRTWLRLMLGVTPSPHAMRDADRLYRQQPAAILRVSTALAEALLTRIWNETSRTLYRGLRLENPALDGQPLPPHPAYSALPTLSFSENPDVAAHFADDGPMGMPVLPILNTVTGRPGLPEHGYIGTAVISSADVLFHWRYARAVPDLLAANADELETIDWQQEVVIRNHPGVTVTLQAFARAAAGYIAARYPGGRSRPAASQPTT